MEGQWQVMEGQWKVMEAHLQEARRVFDELHSTEALEEHRRRDAADACAAVECDAVGQGRLDRRPQRVDQLERGGHISGVHRSKAAEHALHVRAHAVPILLAHVVPKALPLAAGLAIVATGATGDAARSQLRPDVVRASILVLRAILASCAAAAALAPPRSTSGSHGLLWHLGR